VQQSTSGSTELAASAEQMSKMSRSLLEMMDRFVIDVSGNGASSHGSHLGHDRARFAAQGRN
jgi:hypothetical protein